MPTRRPRCSTGHATASIRRDRRSSCSSRRRRCARDAVPEDRTFACTRAAGRARGQLRARMDAADPRRSDGPHTARRRRPAARPGRLVQRLFRAAGGCARTAADRCDAASLFGIEVARPQTAPRLRRTLAHAGYGQGEVLVLTAEDGARGGGHGARRQHRPGALVQRDRRARRRRAAPARRGAGPRPRAIMRDAVHVGHGSRLRAIRRQSPARPARRKSTARRRTRGSSDSRRSGRSTRIAFAVIVENAGYGARSAAPIARRLVTAARDLGMLK